jgi:hypothetical protein
LAPSRQVQRGSRLIGQPSRNNGRHCYSRVLPRTRQISPGISASAGLGSARSCALCRSREERECRVLQSRKIPALGVGNMRDILTSSERSPEHPAFLLLAFTLHIWATGHRLSQTNDGAEGRRVFGHQSNLLLMGMHHLLLTTDCTSFVKLFFLPTHRCHIRCNC